MLSPVRAVRPAWMLGTAALVLLSACAAKDVSTELVKVRVDQRFSTSIHQPPKLTSIESAQTDTLGRTTRVACTTCHSQRSAATLPNNSAELKEFHRGLKFLHGSLQCASCHVQGESAHELLHLANGSLIPMTNVMELCAQCHGPQFRDYKRGAHGGVNGYWDLKQGPRVRNNCVDCHDPHTPQIPRVHPVLPPRDRHLDAPAKSETKH